MYIRMIFYLLLTFRFCYLAAVPESVKAEMLEKIKTFIEKAT
jgi:hypothetical protein